MRNFYDDQKNLKIKIESDEKNVRIRVIDSGVGISRENLKKIFEHGFTTKNSGHGFGLHSCAIYMEDMGGRIEAESAGEKKGACLSLVFPVHLPPL